MKRIWAFAVLFCVGFLMNANAQLLQQGSKIVASGEVGAAGLGTSVSVSSDGNTAIVGGYHDDKDTGAVWVFTRNAGVWTQQGPKLVGTGARGIANQGASVAISSDGNTAIVGGSTDSGYAGAVWVFTRSGGVWTQQGPKLVGTGTLGNGIQGQTVAISSDGNTAIEGGYHDSSFAGAVWVFTRSGGVWTQQGPKLVGTGAVGGASQGYSVAISSDGNTALVGGFVDNNFEGAAWVFTRSGSVWTQQGPKLVGSGVIGLSYQGAAVAISSDGNTAIVGGSGDNNQIGAVWIFTRSAGVWTQQGPKLVGSDAVGLPAQGRSVAISANGDTAIVGGQGDSSQTGAVWVFTRTGGVWTQQGPKLVGTGAVGPAQQGFSVAVSSDGNTVIETGDEDNRNAGAIWVFNRTTTSVTNISGVVPKGFRLMQNYPNPFNPETGIRYQVPGVSNVRLVVYDPLGREVAILVNERKAPGSYEVRFNGSNLASGVYYYRIRAGEFVQTRKFLLLK